jgi:hypothetical protein
MPSATLDLVRPAHLWVPAYEDTLGPEVADMCSAYGFTPDPEQRLILDAMFATNGGRSIRDIGVCAPRQNLKTGVLKMAALGWLYLLELPLIVWSAHEFDTTQEAFRDLCELIEDNPDLDREVMRSTRGKTGIKRGNGDEAIELRGHRRIKFKARTKDGGRGLTGHRVILDEAMRLGGGTIAALVPTLRAVPDPQLVYAGSGGLLESQFWRSVRDRGRPGEDDALAWFEWGDTRPWECGQPDCTHAVGFPGCALDDEDRLRACNSALGRRISMDSLRADRKTFAAFPVKYATETLGWWEDPPTASTDDALAAWPDRANPTATPTAPLLFAVDVAPNMASAAIGVCGTAPTGEVVEVADHRSGSAWVPGKLTQMRADHGPLTVGIIKGSPAEALVPDLEPLDGVTVSLLTAADTTAACATFARAVTDGTVAHRDDPRLNAAVSGARRKFAGDGWRWTRVGSDTDICPLYAVAVARHLWATGPAPYDPLDSIL